jgi:hypothetical protein
MQEHKARAIQRRNGEEILWSHDLSSAFIGMITELYHRDRSVARKKDAWAPVLQETPGEGCTHSNGHPEEWPS